MELEILARDVKVRWNKWADR